MHTDISVDIESMRDRHEVENFSNMGTYFRRKTLKLFTDRGMYNSQFDSLCLALHVKLSQIL